MVKKIGHIYGIIGDLEVDEESGVVQCNITDPNVDINIQEIVAQVNLDLQSRMPITTAVHDAYELGVPPSDDDLDILADGISLQSRGSVLMSHNSPMLDRDPSIGQQFVLPD